MSPAERFRPAPVDDSPVMLSAEIIELAERHAENSHEVWARERLCQGWTYGPLRDDSRKQHPNLVPYADLPESEKAHDRRAALSTLRTIFALGYLVTKS